jgi:hypothetical protein
MSGDLVNSKAFNVRRARSLMAAGGTAVAAVALVGTPAHAQVRPAACTVVNIGLPGKVYVHNVYAGEVEQQYDNCHDVRAHFQWSSAFRAANPNAVVLLSVMAPNGDWLAGGGFRASQSQDAFGAWGYVYTAGDDTWDAAAGVQAACNTPNATGDWHDYTTGAEYGSPSPGSC